MASPAWHLRQWLTPRRWSEALRALRPAPKHPFDRTHGVDTGGLIYADRLSGDAAQTVHNAGYYATAPSLFRGAMTLWRETLPATGYLVEDYTLIDIGCGKGRVLLLASEMEFREIIGIELDPRLARIARKNLRKFGRMRWADLPGLKSETWGTQRVRIIEGDALTASLPDGPVALFYFNSFERPMMEMWLARLAEAASHRTAPLDLIYIHPEFDTLVRELAIMRTVVDSEIPFSKEDAEADCFGVDTDHCAIYRSFAP